MFHPPPRPPRRVRGGNRVRILRGGPAGGAADDRHTGSAGSGDRPRRGEDLWRRSCWPAHWRPSLRPLAVVTFRRRCPYLCRLARDAAAHPGDATARAPGRRGWPRRPGAPAPRGRRRSRRDVAATFPSSDDRVQRVRQPSAPGREPRAHRARQESWCVAATGGDHPWRQGHRRARWSDSGAVCAAPRPRGDGGPRESVAVLPDPAHRRGALEPTLAVPAGNAHSAHAATRGVFRRCGGIYGKHHNSIPKE